MSKTSNQQKAPLCAEFVKQMREAFGEENVKVLWVREGEVELGEKKEEVCAIA